MVGRTVLHYQVTGQLGAGAMGEVYLALNTKLGSQVALKFLPESLSGDDEARARLLLEAQNASRLNHPNIVTIHDIEHFEGRDFIVMEYIEGQTLKDMLSDGPLPIAKVIEIGSALCEGLSAAHEKGIIHRDIKPDNIFITRHGHVKIADFGIARSEQGAGLTRTGMTPGTAYYMSPEQAKGEKNLDGRSDLFSAGAVIYETATGRRPFDGEHLTAVLYELLTENPKPPSTIRPDLPAGFDDFISRALAKSADARFQTADEMASGLRAMSGGDSRASTVVVQPTTRPFPIRLTIVLSVVAMAAVIVVGYLTFDRYFDFVRTPSADHRKTLAVLPFENLGPADQEYFADGLTEEVITKLSTIDELGVVSRTSVMALKGVKKSPREIANELGVEYLMEGSVRWSPSPTGNRMRVTTRLLSGTDDTPRWSTDYDTLMSDMLAIQADIAERVSGAMNITLTDSERQVLARGGTKNGDALIAFYRGSPYFHNGTGAEDLYQAIAAYNDAVRLDSNYVQAWARLSRVYAKMVWWGVGSQEDSTQSRLAMERAQRLDSDAPETQLAGGEYYYRVVKDYPRALEQYRAIERNAAKTGDIYSVYTNMAYVERRLGEFERAIEHLQIALTHDPDRNVDVAGPRFAERAKELGNTFLRLRRWQEADQYLRMAMALAPNEPRAYAYAAQVRIYGHADPDGALQVLTNVRGNDAAEARVRAQIIRKDTAAARQELALSLTQVNCDTAYAYLQRAWIAEISGDQVDRRVAYDSARANLVRLLNEYPTDALLHRYLGISHAGLGRREDALQEGRTALELGSPERDAFFVGPSNIEGMAHIQTILGNYDEAVRWLDSLLTLPAGLVTPAYLKIAPEYDALRGHQGFEMLLSRGRPTASVDSRRGGSLLAVVP